MRRASRQNGVRAAVLALALALPAVAWSITLEQLLSMPFERLLLLKISPPASLPVAQPKAPDRLRPSAEGGQP